MHGLAGPATVAVALTSSPAWRTAGSTQPARRWGACVKARAGGRPQPALERAKEFLSLAQAQADFGLLLAGHRQMSGTLAMSGDFRSAFRAAEAEQTGFSPLSRCDRSAGGDRRATSSGIPLHLYYSVIS